MQPNISTKSNVRRRSVSKAERGTRSEMKTRPKALMSFRQSGYDYTTGLSELCDNSIDADANRIHVDIYGGENRSLLCEANRNKCHTAEEVVISDNGTGMTAEELEESFNLGSDREYHRKDIGKFGLGGTIGSISLCKRKLVLTRKKGTKEIHGRYIDLDAIEESGSLHTTGLKECEISATDLKLFKSRVQNGQSGTVIILQNLDGFSAKQAHWIHKRLSDHIGKHYYKFIQTRTVKFFVNNENVDHTHPLLLDQDGVSLVHEEEIEHEGCTFNIKIADISGWNGEDVASSGWASKKKGNIKTQGGYLVRGDRLISSGFTNDPNKNVSGFWNRHNSGGNIRFLVEATPEADTLLNTNYQKNGFQWDQGLNDKIARVVAPFYKSIARSHKEVLAKPTQDENKMALKKVEEKLNSRKGGKWKVKLDSLGGQGVSSDNKGTVIQINKEHPFVGHVLGKKNIDAKTLVLSLLAAVEKTFAESGESANEDYAEFGDNLARFI